MFEQLQSENDESTDLSGVVLGGLVLGVVVVSLSILLYRYLGDLSWFVWAPGIATHLRLLGRLDGPDRGSSELVFVVSAMFWSVVFGLFLFVRLRLIRPIGGSR